LRTNDQRARSATDRDALFEVRLRARNASALRRSSARQEAEALFKPKRQPVEPSVSDSVPSAERSAWKPRVAANLVAGTVPARQSGGLGGLGQNNHLLENRRCPREVREGPERRRSGRVLIAK